MPDELSHGLQGKMLPPSRASELTQRLTAGETSGHSIVLFLQLAAQRYEALRDMHLEVDMKKRNQQRKAQQKAKQASIGGMVKTLKGNLVPQISRLRRSGPEGDAIITHPLEIDELLRQSMGEIYAGNVSDQRLPHLSATFLNKFGSIFIKAAPFPVPQLHWTDLQQSIYDMPDNTPGMDGVKKSDLVALSPNVLWFLTQLL